MDNESLKDKENTEEDVPVYKDRSLIYMGIVLGLVMAIMGYLTLFMDDPSKLFSKNQKIETVIDDKSSLLDETQSMSDEEVRSSLVKFIEAFYYDQRRGYFDPPSYFANITQTFYIYHNLTHKRLKEIYWTRMENMDNFKRTWIVSTLDFDRVDSRIIATYWTNESYIRRSFNDNYSAQIKYEMIIDKAGKIVSLREAEIKNVTVQKRQPDSLIVNENVIPVTEQASTTQDNKLYDVSLVDVAPEFIGGQKEFAKYVSTAIKYPAAARQNNIQGKVYLSFIVEKDGQINDVKIKQGIGGGCDEEALRILRNSPKWKPGLIKDVPVRTFYLLPITFQL